MEEQVKAPLYEYNRILGTRNYYDEVVEIIAYDIDTTVKGTKHNGVLIVLIALLCVFPITLLKLIHCTWTYLFENDYMETHGTSLSEIFRNDLSTPQGIKKYDENSLALAVTEIEKDNKQKATAKEQARTEALILMRDSLLLSDGKLVAYKIKTVQHAVPEDVLKQDAKNGTLSRAYWTHYLDFGKNMNKCLKEVLPNDIKLSKIKGVSYKCVAISNDCIFDIETKLKNVFLQDDLQICVINEAD